MIDTSIFPALIQNAALLLAMAFVYDLLTSSHRLARWPIPLQLAVGILLGVLGMIIMLSPWRYVPGIVFDTRSVLLGISGLFFGCVPTVVAMAMTAAFRLMQGGHCRLDRGFGYSGHRHHRHHLEAPPPTCHGES
ncbi:MAG: LytS/YhcK type 5TM receptor domain-containing protein [Thermodesulfobacteriota bacterium]